MTWHGERNISGPVGRGHSPEKLRVECRVEKAAGSKRKCEDLIHSMWELQGPRKSQAHPLFCKYRRNQVQETHRGWPGSE